jgi:peptidoglycan/LPS O-acetylase OafA/YrhL
MKPARLGFLHWMLLAGIAAAGFALTIILHHAIEERTVRFAIFVPSVLAMLVGFFLYSAPERPFNTACTVAAALSGAAGIIIIVKDFIIDHNYTPRVALFMIISAAAPFIAAAISRPFCRKHHSQSL